MKENGVRNSTVIRRDQNLFIKDTRITLYDVMDYLKADWPSQLIQQWLNLSDQQMKDVLGYISSHRSEVEREYQAVLDEAQKNRHYWKEKNKTRFAKIASHSSQRRDPKIQRKLDAWKANLEKS